MFQRQIDFQVDFTRQKRLSSGAFFRKVALHEQKAGLTLVQKTKGTLVQKKRKTHSRKKTKGSLVQRELSTKLTEGL